MISAILLAAGESKRMGGLKQLMLLGLGEKTILEHSIENLLSSRVNEVIVVLGYEAERVAERIADRPVRIVVNPAYREGMSASIARGVELVDDRARAIMLALADQPFIDCHIIDCLIDEFDTNNKGIVVPVYKGRSGHPVIFNAKYKEELLALGSQGQARDIKNSHPEDVLRVVVNSEKVIVDIDTVQDYERAQRICEQ